MESREAYKQKMHAKLDQIDAQIDKWQAKRDEASADAKIEYQEKISDLKQKRQEAKDWVNKLSDASEDAWDSVVGGFEDAYKKLSKAL